MTTSSRTAVGGRFAAGLGDLDADLGDVGLLTVGRRVVEGVRARRGRVEEELTVGGERQVERLGGLVLRADQRRELGDEERVVVGVGVVVQDVEAHRLADDGDAGVVAGVGFVVGVLQADRHDDRALGGGGEVVAHDVRQLDPVRCAVDVGGEHHAARGIRHDRAGGGGRVRQRDRLEDERVTVGIDVVGEHVERRRAPLAGRGDVGVRLRRAVAGAVGRRHLDGDDRRGALAAPVGDRVAERDDAGVAGGGRDLHAASVGVDRDHGVAAGRVDLGDQQHVAVRVGVVGEHVDVDRAVDAGLGLVVAGDRRPVRTLFVDLVRLDDLGVRVVGVDLLDHLAALVLGVVLVRLVGGFGQDRTPVLDAVEAPLRAGDPGRPGVDVVDPHPAVDQPEAELGTGAFERRGLDLLVTAPLGERRRRGRHGEQAAPEDDRRHRRAAGELADLGALGALAFAGGEGDGEDAAVSGRGDDMVRLPARLLQDQRRGPAVGIGDAGVERRDLVRGGHEDVAVGVGEHRGVLAEEGERDGVVGEVELGAGLGRAVGTQEDHVVGALVDDHGVAVRRRGGERGALTAQDRLDLVEALQGGQGVTIQPPHAHRVTIDEERAAVDGVDGDVGVDVQRLEHGVGPVVDQPQGAGRAVVHDDDPFRLVDVVVGPRLGRAQGRGDLADGAVHVADVADVPLEQPRAAVVGVGLGALAPFRLQGGDDDGADDQPEHDEHAAGDPAPGSLAQVVPRRLASTCCSLTLLLPTNPTCRSVRGARHGSRTEQLVVFHPPFDLEAPTAGGRPNRS